MYVDNSWLSLLHPHEFSDNFSDMDGFQDGGYIWAQGVLSYHLIKVPWVDPTLPLLKCLILKMYTSRLLESGYDVRLPTGLHEIAQNCYHLIVIKWKFGLMAHLALLMCRNGHWIFYLIKCLNRPDIRSIPIHLAEYTLHVKKEVFLNIKYRSVLQLSTYISGQKYISNQHMQSFCKDPETTKSHGSHHGSRGQAATMGAWQPWVTGRGGGGPPNPSC